MADASYQQYGDPRNGASVNTVFTEEFVSAGEIISEDGYAPAKIMFALKLGLPEIKESLISLDCSPTNRECELGLDCRETG